MQITKRQLLQIIKEESEALGGKNGKPVLSMLQRLWTALMGSEPESEQLRDLEGKLDKMTVEELMAYMKKLEGGDLVSDTGKRAVNPAAQWHGGYKEDGVTFTQGKTKYESDEEEGEPLEESIRKIVRRHALKESIRGVVRKHTAKKRRRSRRG